MKYKRVIYVVVILLIIFSIGFTYINKTEKGIVNDSDYTHVEKIKNGANPDLGVTELPENYEIGPDFVSHLPLVIIDTYGDTIPDAYKYNFDEERFVLKDENIEAYIGGQISIIDNENSVNTLKDDASIVSNMKIKHRGNSSIVFDKHQYRIKLLNEDGLNNKVGIMGMEPSEDWILNISMIDSSLIRNYIAYTLSAKIMEFSPEVKFCEVIKKNGETYTYEGIYLMMESVKQGKGRVDIADYRPERSYTGYILRRDRYDEEELMVEDTYALKNNLGYGYLGIKYPGADKITEDTYKYIVNEVDTIEKVIYSQDKETFLKYNNFIDEDSFINYFIINEYFANYDAGNNSTYMYKDKGGKLKIGPVWDYDNAMDNIGGYILDTKSINFQGQTWFKELVQSEAFCKKLKKRYSELSESYLSTEYINNFIDETILYLGNARQRDWNRWESQYTKERFELLKDTNGITVDRNFTSSDDAVYRVKDILHEHSLYIKAGLQKLQDDSIYKESIGSHPGLAVIFVGIIFISTVVIRRVRD